MPGNKPVVFHRAVHCLVLSRERGPDYIPKSGYLPRKFPKSPRKLERRNHMADEAIMLNPQGFVAVCIGESL
jgi:hypothetical protein